MDQHTTHTHILTVSLGQLAYVAHTPGDLVGGEGTLLLQQQLQLARVQQHQELLQHLLCRLQLQDVLQEGAGGGGGDSVLLPQLGGDEFWRLEDKFGMFGGFGFLLLQGIHGAGKPWTLSIHAFSALCLEPACIRNGVVGERQIENFCHVTSLLTITLDLVQWRDAFGFERGAQGAP